MAATPFTIDPVTPAIGAEITGIDLGDPLDDETRDLIYQALVDHLVLLFPDQDLSPETHLDFAKSFGEIDRPHPIYPSVDGFPNIVMLENDAERQPDTNAWHTDLTFYPEPPFASILWARDVPISGGDTLWASMYAAYDALPEEIKAHIAPLSTVHEMGDFRNGFLAEGGPEALSEAMTRMGCAVHPIVEYHPVTGRPLLYVNRSFTSHVVGLPRVESDRLLGYLFDHIDRPEFQMRYRWRAGALVMWDNRVTQHYAVNDYAGSYRCMHRVTVLCDRRAVS